MLCDWIGALGKSAEWVQKKNSIVLSPKIHAAENNEKKNCCMKIELSTVVKIMKNDQFCSAYVCVRCSFIVKGYECAVC